MSPSPQPGLRLDAYQQWQNLSKEIGLQIRPRLQMVHAKWT